MNRLIFLISFALVSFTSSMDNWLNFNILGFNLRFSVIVMTFTVIYFGFQMLKEKFFNFPLIIFWLIAFGVLNFIFSFNSVFLIRSFFYSLWLFVFIGWIVIIFYYLKNNPDVISLVLKIYIFSFLPAMFLGWLQWAIPSLLVRDDFLWKTQAGLDFLGVNLQRANGWNYEPSYYATYLIVLPPILWSFIKLSSNIKSRLFYVAFFMFSLLIIFLSTSRMGWIGIFLFLIFVILFEIFSFLIRKRLLGNKVFILSFVILFLVSIVFTGIFLKKGGYRVIEKKIKDSFAYSYSDRLEGSRNVFEVLLRHPFKAVSIGGVSSDIAYSFTGRRPEANSDVKSYEGSMVILEVLAGLGVFGAFVMGAIIFSLFFKMFKKLKTSESKIKILVFGFFFGLVLQIFLLMFNQNLLRVYFWNNFALFISVLFILNQMDYLPFSKIEKTIFSLINSIFIVSISIFLFLYLPYMVKVKIYGGKIVLNSKNFINGRLFYNTGRGMWGLNEFLTFNISNGVGVFSFEDQYKISKDYFREDEASFVRQMFFTFWDKTYFNEFSIIKDRLFNIDQNWTNSDKEFLYAINKLIDDDNFFKRYSLNTFYKTSNRELNRFILEHLLPFIPRNPEKNRINEILFEISFAKNLTNENICGKVIWNTSLGEFEDDRKIHFYKFNEFAVRGNFKISKPLSVYIVYKKFMKSFIIISLFLFLVTFVLSYFFYRKINSSTQ
ncbi:MAG: O-antigen ligase family protein [Brevinematia bacterium]